MNKPYYLSTPYTRYPSGHEEANLAAAKLAAGLIENGYMIFSPITHSHIIAKFLSPEHISFEKWEQLDLWAIANSSGILVGELTGWKESAGISRELEYARSILVPIWYVNPVTLDVKHQPHDL